MLSVERIAALPRLLLKIVQPTDRPCALCAGPIGPTEDRVSLPMRAGTAHPHCAVDHGFRVR